MGVRGWWGGVVVVVVREGAYADVEDLHGCGCGASG